MTDVLIAGAGPTGLMLAAELALAGVEVTVLDRRDGPGLPRPVGLQPRTAELFDLRGLDTGPEVDGPSGHFAGLPVTLDHSVWRTRHPRVRNRTQDDVEVVLAGHAAEHGAVIERGHEITAVDVDADGVTVDGVRARWLVACDGAHSTVRRLLALPFPGRTETYVATLAHIRLAAASDLVPARAAHFSQVTRQANGYWARAVQLAQSRLGAVQGHQGFGDFGVRHGRVATRRGSTTRRGSWSATGTAASCSPATPPTSTPRSAGRGSTSASRTR
ncbi:FAD-dependent monooxygenase [Amycolatopsis sp. NPDC003865]